MNAGSAALFARVGMKNIKVDSLLEYYNVYQYQNKKLCSNEYFAST